MTSTPFPRTSTLRESLRRWAAYGALAVVFGLLFTNALLDAHSDWVLIRFPYGFDYGEGIVWQQMRNILRGHAYGPLGTFPAIVYHYPPVYHLTVGAAAALAGIDQLAMGRIVSIISTFGTAALAGWMAIAARPSESRAVNVATAWLTALVFLTAGPVGRWAPLMRVDMLAGLLSLAGLVLAIRAVDRPRLVIASALCFLLSIYAKQTSIAAPAAAFAGLLAVRPRLALYLAALSLTAGLITLGLLSWLTDGGFLRHILLYNINRMHLDLILRLSAPLREHALYLALAGFGAVLLSRDLRPIWQERLNHAPRVTAIIATLVFFEIKTLMLVMTIKSGAGYNYLIEWLCSVAILVGVAAMPALAATIRQIRGGPSSRESLALPILVLLGIAVQAKALPPRILTMNDERIEAMRDAEIVALIRAAPRPVISDDMTLLIRAGRDVEWEPAIAAELGATGIYDQPGFVRMIDQQRFGLFITDGDRGESDFDSRYNPPVVSAITLHYPNVRRMGHLLIRSPRD